MIKARLYLPLLLLFFLFFLSCKKDESTTQQNGYVHYDTHPTIDTSCRLITTFSSDTNYIPHKKNNTWYYCSGYTVIAPKLGLVVYDTIIQNVTYFNITFTDPSNNVPSWTDRYFIDSLGRYYSVSLNQYSGNCLDTLLLINPLSSNGDTIYNKSSASIKVVLINKNETVQNIPNCYHISVINPSSANYTAIQYYFKKGVGSLFYHGTLKSAQIN
jgi:hypothetical protein